MITYGFWFYHELQDKVGVEHPACHNGDREDSYIFLDTPHQTHEVKVSSLRMELFRQNPKCVTCHRVGTLWLLEAHRKNERPHLNLYHVEDEGSCLEWKKLCVDGLVMMTKDHIIPRAAGGPTNLDNLQTMCTICNGKKGQRLMHELPEYERKAMLERLGRSLVPAEMQCLGGKPHFV